MIMLIRPLIMKTDKANSQKSKAYLNGALNLIIRRIICCLHFSQYFMTLSATENLAEKMVHLFGDTIPSWAYGVYNFAVPDS